MDDLRNKFPASPFTLSKLELVDAVSDGAALTAVWLLEADPVFKGRLLYAWSRGGPIAQGMAVGIEAIGLSGSMALSLVAAFLAQWGLASRAHSIRADFAGLGATSEVLLGSKDPLDKAFLLNVARVLAEGLPQLAWQTSALMAEGCDLLDSPVLLISLVLTLATTVKKGLDFIKMGVRATGIGRATRISDRSARIGRVLYFLSHRSFSSGRAQMAAATLAILLLSCVSTGSIAVNDTITALITATNSTGGIDVERPPWWGAVCLTALILLCFIPGLCMFGTLADGLQCRLCDKCTINCIPSMPPAGAAGRNHAAEAEGAASPENTVDEEGTLMAPDGEQQVHREING